MKKIVTAGMALWFILSTHNCRQIRESAESGRGRLDSEPVIEITPLEQGSGRWKVAASDAVTVAVTAPGAMRIRILCRLVGVEEHSLELRTLAPPVDGSTETFVTRLNVGPDFAGEVWAEALYPGGAKKRTETIALAVDAAGHGSASRLDVVGGSVGTDESARSDKLTGGRVLRTKLIAGEPDVRITVNAPAFQLTLWQNGKEIGSYHIGVSHKDFSLPVGEREAAAIIFNPSWIPPGVELTPWLNERSADVKIKPDDPRRRLGDIRIPLGAGYMIREAASAADIGRALSHGCILMLGDDLRDLAWKIVAARNMPVEKSRTARSAESAKRFAAPLDPPVLVDINYDLQVVEGGVLRIYPDVYERGAFALDSLRAELQTAGVRAPLLVDQSLRSILDRVDADTQFVISVADIRKGRLGRGRKLPLIVRPVENKREVSAISRR